MNHTDTAPVVRYWYGRISVAPRLAHCACVVAPSAGSPRGELLVLNHFCFLYSSRTLTRGRDENISLYFEASLLSRPQTRLT